MRPGTRELAPRPGWEFDHPLPTTAFPPTLILASLRPFEDVEMTRRLSLMVLACLTASAVAFVPAPVYKAPPPKRLLQQLLGRWEDTVPNVKPILVIDKDTWVYSPRDGTGERERLFMSLDATKDPATIDLKPHPDDSPKGRPSEALRGIVKVEGDTLTFCFARSWEKNAVRPVDFEAKGSRNVFKRKK